MLHVGGDNIESHTGTLFGMRTAGELGRISGKYLFDERDILYSKIRPYLNKVATPDFRGVCSADIYPLRPKKGVATKEFIAKVLRSRDFLDFAETCSSRTSIPKINRDSLLRYECSLPPLPEQKRIAAILDKADAIRRKRQEAIRLTEALLRSAFLDMFGDPVTNPKGWEVKKLGEVLDVATGGTPSRAVEENYGGDIPWVTTGEVTGSIIASTSEHLTARGLRESNCKVFPVGTVVIAMYGQGATRGRCALLGIDACTNQACAAILPSTSLPASYLFTMLRLRYDELRALGRGGNQPNLNLALVRGVEVALPSGNSLGRFDQFFERHLKVLNIMRGVDSVAAALSNALTQRAFAGGL